MLGMSRKLVGLLLTKRVIRSAKLGAENMALLKKAGMKPSEIMSHPAVVDAGAHGLEKNLGLTPAVSTPEQSYAVRAAVLTKLKRQADDVSSNLVAMQDDLKKKRAMIAEIEAADFGFVLGDDDDVDGGEE
jgi:hypothetical protein